MYRPLSKYKISGQIKHSGRFKVFFSLQSNLYTHTQNKMTNKHETFGKAAESNRAGGRFHHLFLLKAFPPEYKQSEEG